jgi:NADH dehydrogenase/NADH:ubiquinone oxidoreductase subunit G
MKININDYRKQKKFILEAYENGGVNALPLMCALTYCPIIAACYYCAEEFGMTEELENKIKNLKKFYGYDTIIGYEKREV